MRFTRHIRQATTAIAVAAGCARGSDRQATDSANAQMSRADPPAAAFRVTARGIGPVRAGMTLGDASAAVAGALAAPPGVDSAACAYLAWPGGPAGARVMIEDGRIARIDVDSGTIATDVGARVGDSEERIQSLYAGRVTVTPHKYNAAGHYLTVAPAAPLDSAYRLIFETEGERVVRYRAGRRPPVEYVEGCS